MPRIIYANMIWFLLVIASMTGASLMRHDSPKWDEMSDIRLNYDVLFVGVFGIYGLVSIVGLWKKKRWGYRSAMGFNSVLAALVLIPLIGLVIYDFKNGIPLSFLSNARGALSLENIVLSITSIIFIIFMRRPRVKSVFN